MTAIAPASQESDVLAALIERLRQLVRERSVHPSRTVVLVPYAQLMPLARQLWARGAADGYIPRFETTLNWASRLGFAPSPTDLSFDRGLDLLTARHWLERAGLGAQASLLAPRLVDAAWQLATPAAAVPPHERPAWAERARAVAGLGLEPSILALEAAIARIAIEWAAASAFATDSLQSAQNLQSLDLLVALQGLQPEPLVQALARALGERAVCWPLDDPAPAGQLALHVADDPADEAELAAACVVHHLQQGLAPVALAATDRVLTRRIRAMLDARGVGIADETGWKLSTTRAAAQVMGALRACAWDASTDAVIDWLKHTPALAPGRVSALERRLRRLGLRRWTSFDARRPGMQDHGWPEWLDQIQSWRERLGPARALTQWQLALREHLQEAGAWDALESDPAGAQLIATLGLDEAGEALWARQPQGARRLSLADFTAWANEVLEAAGFVPQAPVQPQVVILPFNQLLGRRFAALVLPGCDEVRLAASPEPPGPWTAAQREVLGLPSREALEAVLREGWRHALQTARVDLLWRCRDESGEPVLPSPLVQALALRQAGSPGVDARESRVLPLSPVARPAPTAARLPLERLSASAYEDLRRCPYRFFAMRQLGLQSQDEIDAELDKRDFGTWVHEVLCRFHRAQQDDFLEGREAQASLLDRMAAEVTRDLHLPPAEFLPFEAAWPQVREGYLDELERFVSKEQARFESAETDHDVPCGPVRLIGRIDRIDRLPDGRRMVMDYKTEGLATTQARIKQPLEDTQLAFYAALLEDDSLRAAYVNVGERGQSRILEQPAVMEARDALRQGVLRDLERIAQGAALPALGEGTVCEHCAARGLCRKDFWVS